MLSVTSLTPTTGKRYEEQDSALTISVRQAAVAAQRTMTIRQAARAAFITSSFKIFLTQTFPRCGATCYILPSRAMTQLFNGVNFVYRSVEVYLTFCSYLQSFSQNPKLLQWRMVLTTLAICRVMF